VKEITCGIDGENEGETYGIGRGDKEIYRSNIHSAPCISKINVHSSLQLYKYDNRRGYSATAGREWERPLFFMRDRLARYLEVCPWEFKPGWSGKERTTEVGIEANLYDPDIRWGTKESYFSLYSTLIGKTVKQGRDDHPRMAHWIPPGHYDPGIGYTEIMRRYVEDSKKGMFVEYRRSIKDTYLKECEVFWRDIKKRYDAELSTSNASLAEMLANQVTNDDTKKRKCPPEDDDMKPASKP
jgi:hypothetical protein